MVLDAEIEGLKDAYEVWQSREILHEYGPLRAYAPADHMEIQEMWREKIYPALQLVAKTQTRLPDGTTVAHAPSPWHAYFFLRAEQQFTYRAGRLLGSSLEEADSTLGEHLIFTVGEHLFFRGQRCSSWPFVSSLSRKNKQEREVDERAVLALTEYFRALFCANEDVAANTGRCFAQHYGIATYLADISCDPDIAVWFATHPVGKPCTSGEANAAVQAVSWAGQKRGTKTVCLLPPPFVRNVYTQRGLFIDTSKNNGVLAGKITLRVEFPRHTEAGEFRVIRHGQDLAVLPTLDAVEKDLVDWARRTAAESVDSDDVRSKVAKARADNSLPRFWVERELWDFDKQLGDWLSMLDWILPATCVTALPVSGASAPMQRAILESKVIDLVSANPTFFIEFVKASENSDFSGFEDLREVLRIARRELDK